MAKLVLRVNGKSHEVDADPETPLLYILRNDLGLNGPRFGCGLGQCGACAVLVDGTATFSCVTQVSDVTAEGGSEIVTLEGLGTPESPHPLQSAFIDEQAVQCGYCVNGQIIGAASLLNESPNPSDEEIREGMAPFVCRCGTHIRVAKAIQRAARAS